MEDNSLKAILEALLFVGEKPLTIEQLKQAFEEDLKADEIRSNLELLKKEYVESARGFRLVEVAGGYQLVTDARLSAYLKRFFQSREKRKLSQASLETLSVVAYKQPVTRADIEFIRGVNVDGALKTLLENRLVRMVGRKEVPGRPMLFGTTKEFLEHFGLNTLDELPSLTEFTEKDIASHLLPPQMKDERVQPAEASIQSESSNERG